LLLLDIFVVVLANNYLEYVVFHIVVKLYRGIEGEIMRFKMLSSWPILMSEAGPSQSSEDLQEGSHSRKRQHEEEETVELQTEEEAGTEQQGGTGGNTEGEDVDMIMTCTKPNQPDPKVLQKQKMKDRTLTFQKSWYEKYPWLHVQMGTDGVVFSLL